MSVTLPRFSVLLPTHNRADVLGLAICSVLAQTEPDFELLIVADGCTDSTREVISNFNDPRIRVFDLPKAPHFGYANRNVALSGARGRLIAIAGDDDLLLPDHLAVMGALLDSSGAAWGYSRPLWVSTDGVIVPFGTNLAFSDEMRAFFGRGNTIPAACVVHTRAVLEEVGYWPENVPAAADWVLWRRMLAISGYVAARTRMPTNLHFSADWKNSRFAASEEVRRLVELADTAPWWPALLRHPPAAESEQATIWRALSAGGAKWPMALRAAIDAVTDRIAWMTVYSVAEGEEPMIDAITRHRLESATLRGALEASSSDAGRLTAEADALRSSLEASSEEVGRLRVETAALHSRSGEVARLTAEADALRSSLEASSHEVRRLRAEAAALHSRFAVSLGEVARLTTEADALRGSLEASSDEVRQLRVETAALRSSTSWRVTAPMRTLARGFRIRRGR